MAKRAAAGRSSFFALGIGLLLGAAAVSQVQKQTRGPQSPPPLPKPGPEARLEPVTTRIVSSDGALLAFSQSAFEFGVDYAKVPESPAFWVDLAAATGIDAGELEPRGAASRYWKEPISPAAASLVRSANQVWKADGVSLKGVTVRRYPLGEATAALVGSVRNGVPVNGLERTLALQSKGGGTSPAELRLTIDSRLQLAALAAVRRAVLANNAVRGAAVVLDPKDGDVLASASWPTFDPEDPASGSDLDATTMLAFEPGSTFKVLTTALAIDQGLVHPSTTLYCSGQVVVGKHTIRCAHGAHGTLDTTGVVAQSCNVAAARWAMQIGHDGFRAAIARLGLLDKPGLGLPGERAGKVDDTETATRLQTANWGYGQAVTCVPVTLAAAYASLANGGSAPRPRLVSAVDGRELPAVPPVRFVSERTAGEVLRMMEAVVESDQGTGKHLRIPGYRLAGKTGTAQKLGRDKGKHVSNFVGFVPAEKPQAVILVMVDTPRNGQYYGGAVAGPPFREIAEAVIQRLGIPAERATVR